MLPRLPAHVGELWLLKRSAATDFYLLLIGVENHWCCHRRLGLLLEFPSFRLNRLLNPQGGSLPHSSDRESLPHGPQQMDQYQLRSLLHRLTRTKHPTRCFFVLSARLRVD
jgi:hypothetical protein